jgi:ABC-type lipoprotein release transport system permease subunit
LVVLALLAAIAGGIAMTAITGARRSAVVVAETMNERRQPDVIHLTPKPDVDWDPIVQLPYVESYSVFAATPLCVRETGGLGRTFGSEDAICDQPPIEGGAQKTIARMDMLEGRMPTGPREVAVNRLGQERLGIEIGDRLHFEGVRPSRLQKYWGGEQRGRRPWGPTFAVRVTGVFTGSDDFWRVISGGNGQPGIALSRAFFPTFGDSLGYLRHAYLRLRGGEDDIPRLVRDITRITGDGAFPVRNIHDARRRVERSTDTEATALLLFALALIVAALVLIGQALARAVRSSAGAAVTLRSLGMPPRAIVGSLAAPGFAVGIAAAAGAVVVALATSPLVPIGLARSFELDRGIKADIPVLALGALAIFLVTALAATATAALEVRRAGRPRGSDPSRAPRSITRMPLPLTVALGARMALERRPGIGSAPVRPALVGATIGVLAVAAALTVRHGLVDSVDHPDRAGQTWDAAYAPTVKKRAIARDPDIAGAAKVARAVVNIGGLPVPAYAVQPIGRPLERVVIDGRAPRGPGEVALGPSTASALGVDIGERLAAGRSGANPVRVVGTALLWEDAGSAAYDEGVWTSPAGLRRLKPAQTDWTLYFVDLRQGADRTALDRRLAAAGGERDGHWPNDPPAGLDNLETSRGLPLLLGLLLAVLGAGTVGHGLLTSLRRRNRDLAVVRALGLSGRQARATLAWQATTVAAIGVIVGLPLGIAAGHLIWWLIATSLPVVYVAPGIALAAVAVAPAALLVANAIALWPGRRAARSSPAAVLRAE